MTASFTGSQHGMTSRQREELHDLLTKLRPDLGVHGACIGADDIFDQLCNQLEIPRLVFPGNDNGKRVPFQELTHRANSRVTIASAKPALERNKDIVRAGDYLIACPRQAYEVVRSGTWTTVRAAKRLDRQVYLILP